jgi:hypothetical protein
MRGPSAGFLTGHGLFSLGVGYYSGRLEDLYPA